MSFKGLVMAGLSRTVPKRGDLAEVAGARPRMGQDEKSRTDRRAGGGARSHELGQEAAKGASSPELVENRTGSFSPIPAAVSQ